MCLPHPDGPNKNNTLYLACIINCLISSLHDLSYGVSYVIKNVHNNHYIMLDIYISLI